MAKNEAIQSIIDKVQAVINITDDPMKLDLLNDILRDLKKLQNER